MSRYKSLSVIFKDGKGNFKVDLSNKSDGQILLKRKRTIIIKEVKKIVIVKIDNTKTVLDYD